MIAVTASLFRTLGAGSVKDRFCGVYFKIVMCPNMVCDVAQCMTVQMEEPPARNTAHVEVVSARRVPDILITGR